MAQTVTDISKEMLKLIKSTAEEFVSWNKTPMVRAGFVICDEEHFRGMKLSEELTGSKKACYVLIKKNGKLRGCMGNLFAVEPDFASELIRNTVAAVSKDMRFEPVSAEELPLLEYSVFCVNEVSDVLQESCGLTEIGSGCANTGVLVSSGCRQAIVLPFEDEGLSFADKIKEACVRANISPDEKPLVKKIIFA